jgi:hypothetical protein
MNTNKQKNKKNKKADLTIHNKKDIQKKEEKLIEKNLEYTKNDNLFTIDTKPNDIVKHKFLTNKKKRDKVSKVEERIIKRMKKAEEFKNDIVEEKIVKDLWADEQPSKKIAFPNARANILKYPKVPLPHPGQSYNPSKEDLSNLLNKVVELNKRAEVKEDTIEVEKRVFLSDDEEEEIVNLEDFKVSNNPAVDEGDRKTKVERNRKIRAKLNRIKNEEDRKKKQTRINLSRVKSLKNIKKEQEKAKVEERSKRLTALKVKKETEELIKLGVINE